MPRWLRLAADPDLFKYPLAFMWGHPRHRPPDVGIRPSYYRVFEDNDPSKRLMVMANYDNDVPEYWEWSGQGLFPFDASNEAYKLGVNYVVYGLTH